MKNMNRIWVCMLVVMLLCCNLSISMAEIERFLEDTSEETIIELVPDIENNAIDLVEELGIDLDETALSSYALDTVTDSSISGTVIKRNNIDALAAKANNGNDFKIKNGKLVEYTGNESEVVIPSSVKIIGKNAFYDIDELESIIIPSSVKEIEEMAFRECFYLSSVTILAKRINIDDLAFFCDNTFYRDPYFYIISGSDAIDWANDQFYYYEIVDSIISAESLTLKLSQTYKLTVYGCKKDMVTWTSSNNKVATVKDGKVKAVKAGKCTIKAKVKGGKTHKCTVKVTDPVKLSQEKIVITKDETSILKLTGLVGRSVTWSSSDKTVVMITKKSNKFVKIKALKNGKSVIVANIKNGPSLKCVVSVLKPLTVSVDELLEESGYNKVWLNFSNNSPKDIVYVQFSIAQYNNRGDTLKGPYNSYYLNETVKSHESDSYYFWVHDDTKKVKISIKEVTFSDKTRWIP